VIAFASEVTSSMTRLHIITGQQGMHLRTLRKFLIHQGVSGSLSARVQENAIQALRSHQQNVPEEDVQLLSLVSEPLRIELHFAYLHPHLIQHPLFEAWLNESDTLLRLLCHSAMKVMSVSAGDILFSRGEVPLVPQMLFVLKGSLGYTRDGDEYEYLEGEGWICEHVLWSADWIYHGLLEAEGQSSIACLNAERFQQLSGDARFPRIDLWEYAKEFLRWVNDMNDMQRSDLMSMEEAISIVTKVVPGFGRHQSRNKLQSVFW